MFTKKDIEVLKGMFEVNNDSLVRQMRDEMHATVHASENRILHSIGEMLHVSVLPQISDLDRRVTRIERHPKLA